MLELCLMKLPEMLYVFSLFSYHYQSSMKSASHELYSTLLRRAFFSDITVVLPKDWPSSCLPANHHDHIDNSILPSIGERSDITISVEHPIYGNNMWTEQVGGCGAQGKQIHASYLAFNRPNAGKEFLLQWAKYRYGVFDETGFDSDTIYPKWTQSNEGIFETWWV